VSRTEPPARRKVAWRTRVTLWQARWRIRFARIRGPLVLLLRGVLVLAVTAFGAAAGRLLEQYVRTAPAFATRHIEIGGASQLSREQVLAAAGLALGQNVFQVSPEQARARLERNPWVLEAHVRRRLPGSYRIELVEQQPAALLQLDALYLVSEESSVLKRMAPTDRADLPIITGVDPAQFRADLPFRASLLVNAVALLHDYRDAGLWRREPIAEIHAEGADSFALYVGKEPMLVRLGKRPYRQKLSRLRQILDELRGDGERPAYVYLDNTRRADRVPVRLR
jgi:cell division protein FtsQ